MRPVLQVILLLLSAASALAGPKEFCFYKDEHGAIKQTDSLMKVPLSMRKAARCFSPGDNHHLARPEEIELKGAVRREDMTSALGRIELRWPRLVEVLFGRTPQRAMADAAATVSRVLNKAGFPAELRNLDLHWQVVFMDEKLPEKQIPSYLVNSCHPAWMTPPSHIYVIAQRVAAGCSGQKTSSSFADAQLAQVLIHEIGHALEHRLLGAADTPDRMRSEGFATWFEIFAAESSSVIPRGSVRKMYGALAQQALKESPQGFRFAGSAADYGRASLYFSAIVERRGVSGLMEVYKTMRAENLDFLSAIRKTTGWDEKKLAEEVRRVL